MAILFTFTWTGLVVVIGLSLLFYKLTKSKIIFVLVFAWFAFTRFGHVILPPEKDPGPQSYYSVPERLT